MKVSPGGYIHSTTGRWLTVVVVALLGLGAGVSFALSKPTSFSATAEILVTTGNEPSAEAANAGVKFSQAQIASYAQLIVSKENMTRALKSIGSTESPIDLAAQTSVTFVPKSTILDVTVKNADARQAAILANAIGEQFTTFAVEVDTPPLAWWPPNFATADEPIHLTRATIASPAVAANFPTSRYVALYAVGGAFAGGIVGFALASWWAAGHRPGERPTKAASSTDQVSGD